VGEIGIESRKTEEIEVSPTRLGLRWQSEAATPLLDGTAIWASPFDPVFAKASSPNKVVCEKVSTERCRVAFRIRTEMFFFFVNFASLSETVLKFF